MSLEGSFLLLFEPPLLLKYRSPRVGHLRSWHGRSAAGMSRSWPATMGTATQMIAWRDRAKELARTEVSSRWSTRQ